MKHTVVSFRVRDKVRDSLRGEVRVRFRAFVRGRGVLGHNIYSPIDNLLWRNFLEIQVRLNLQNYLCRETSDFVAISGEFWGFLATTFCYLATSDFLYNT